MNTQIMSKKKPEEEEFDKKKVELASLESNLAECELELATLQAELRSFEIRYLRIVGVRYAELDQVEAEIAEALARLHPSDHAAQQRAEHTRTQARDSTDATRAAESNKAVKFETNESLKKLYRDAAKRFHPDLATDDKDRARRTKIMAEINSAYSNGDEARLLSILEGWERGSESVEGEGIGVELVRIIRKISQIRTRLESIKQEMQKLKESDLNILMEKVVNAEREGRDLLKEMAQKVDADVASARARLSDLTWKQPNP